MKLSEIISGMRAAADALELIKFKVGDSNVSNVVPPKPAFTPDQAVGAAGFLCYLRDGFMVSPHDQWSREKLLVLLETHSRDSEVFPLGIGQAMWAAEVEEEVVH